MITSYSYSYIITVKILTCFMLRYGTIHSNNFRPLYNNTTAVLRTNINNVIRGVRGMIMIEMSPIHSPRRHGGISCLCRAVGTPRLNHKTLHL